MEHAGEITSADGTCYLTPPLAAQRLGMKDVRHLDKLLTDGALESTERPELLGQVSGRGRRPKHLITVASVEACREDLLKRLGANEEIVQLRAELVQVREAWEAETLTLMSRIDKLEKEKQRILRAVRARSDAWAAQVEADAAFLSALDIETEDRHPSGQE